MDRNRKAELEKLADQLIKLKSGPESPTEAPVIPPTQDSSDTAADENARSPDTAEDTVKQIQAFLNANGSLTLGQVELLNLGSVREKTSNASRLLLEGLETVTQRSIAKHLSDEDSFTKCEDDYLISFAQQDEAAARAKSQSIIKDITEWLSGQDEAEEIRAESFVSTMSAEDIAGSTHSADAVFAALSSAKLLNELRQQYERSPDTHLPEDLAYLFRPIWHVDRKVISTFQCIPVWFTESGRFLVGDKVLPDEPEPELVLEMDLRVLLEAGHALRIQQELGHTQLVSAPVHYSTLNRQRFHQRYLAALLNIPRDHRRLLVLEVTELPDGVPKGRLLDASMSLKEHCRARIVKVSTERMSDLSMVAEANFLATGIDLEDKARSERVLMEKMESFAAAANRYSLKTYVHGLSSLSLTTAAVCSGFNYIDGEAVAPLVETPSGLASMNLEKLYAGLFGQARQMKA